MGRDPCEALSSRCFDGLMTFAAIKNSMKSMAWNEKSCVSGFVQGVTFVATGVDYLDIAATFRPAEEVRVL